MISATDLAFLRRAIELAKEALPTGDMPFGTVLVGEDGEVLFEDRNREGGGDATMHPEFEIARWAARNLAPEVRATATVYTSGEHCAMCSAAHAWVGLGRIVYAGSAEQYAGWMAEFGIAEPPVTSLPIRAVAPGIPVDGPALELVDELRAMHQASFER